MYRCLHRHHHHNITIAIVIITVVIIVIIIIIVSMSLILHAVERLGIDLDSEESEYDAYVFYQVHSHT